MLLSAVSSGRTASHRPTARDTSGSGRTGPTEPPGSRGAELYLRQVAVCSDDPLAKRPTVSITSLARLGAASYASDEPPRAAVNTAETRGTKEDR